jgi:hypothetical protein
MACFRLYQVLYWCRSMASNKHFKFRVSAHKCARISFITHVLHSHYIICKTMSSDIRSSLEFECSAAVLQFSGSQLLSIVLHSCIKCACLHVCMWVDVHNDVLLQFLAAHRSPNIVPKLRWQICVNCHSSRDYLF